MKPLLAGLLVFFLMSCSKTKINTDLPGIWVSEDKYDTISFKASTPDLLEVKRYFVPTGRRMMGSGPYFYKLKLDSINPQYAISSMLNLKFYYFKKDGYYLTIGNFFAMEKSSLNTKFKKISN